MFFNLFVKLFNLSLVWSKAYNLIFIPFIWSSVLLKIRPMLKIFPDKFIPFDERLALRGFKGEGFMSFYWNCEDIFSFI